MTATVELTGKLVELGDLGETGPGHGFVVETAGEFVELTGLKKEEVKALATLYRKRVKITIEPAAEE